MLRVTLKQIAAEAGVSLATVSAVLSGKAGHRRIASQTAQRVVEVGRRLGYHSPPSPGTMTHNIGVILRGRVREFLSNPFYGEIFHGIQEELGRQKFNLLFSGTQENLESAGIPHALRQRQVDGLILLGQMPDAYVQTLVEYGALVVCVNFDKSPQVASVVIDGIEEAKQAMQYLAQCRHANIAYLASNTGSQHSQQHELGYVQNLAGGINPIVYTANGADPENGRSAIATALGELTGKPLPFACLLAENDTLAAGAIDALRTAGICVPADVSVMGGQDLQVAGVSGPSLTTTFVDKLYMGKIAASHLINMIAEGESRPVRIVVPTRVIERESVAIRPPE
jgi:LacI family transcriptional regulator